MSKIDDARSPAEDSACDSVDTHISSNATTYSDTRVVRSYQGFRGLFPAERAIIKRYLSHFVGDVLDIAVGAGRTTRVLARLGRRYVGIDFSDAMITAANGVVPGKVESRTELHRLDMRDVPRAFSDDRFDAIFISYNGIDYISWEDRNRLLSELRPMLKANGVLAFSTHDLSKREAERGFRIRDDLRIDSMLVRRRPLSAATRLARLPLWLLRALPNRWRNRPREKHFGDYAYVNDMGDNYGLVTTYVSREAQIAKLATYGYRHVEVLHPWMNDQYTSFNYFVCRTAGR